MLPVYVWAPEEEGRWVPGAAQRWWLHHALAALDDALCQRGSRLLVRSGPALEVLQGLMAESGATAVYWTRRYEPVAMARDEALKSTLRQRGIEVRSFPGAALREPFEILNRAGAAFQVYTPFFKHYLALGDVAAPLPPPAVLAAPERWPEQLSIAALGLLPRLGWANGFSNHWKPGLMGAERALEDWVAGAVQDYAGTRNFPALTAGVSRLSPHLHFGELSPRRLWWAVRGLDPLAPLAAAPGLPWLRQLIWREFAQHLLFHFPHTDQAPLRPEFADFPWADGGPTLTAWQRGETGYPLVDAGMRELWQTGYLHNRVRMVVASFLVKHLLIDWRAGADWFWDTLLDADLANNTLGWQWSAGCGADAAPYFRIFNPVLQGTRFDAAGDYVRRWVPELARLPDAHLHAPWQMPAGELAALGVTLGRSYPAPLVEHSAARERALKAYARMTGRRPAVAEEE